MKKLDLIGKKFGLLTVIEETNKTSAGHSNWICKCECGNFVNRTGTSLRRSKYSSCDNCRGTMIRRENSKHFKGVGEISATWFDEVVVRSANGSKGNRKIKEINIDINYLWELFLKQNRKCVYTNLELSFPKNNSNGAKKDSTVSLDRIDSNKGYIKGNVQFVHKHVNIMKNVFEHNYFIDMCKLIAGNNCEVR